MRKTYETPDIKVTSFEVEDIMTTSLEGTESPNPGGGGLPVLPGT